MKRIVLLLLCVFLSGLSFPIQAEQEAVPANRSGIACDFSLRLRLNMEAFSPSDQGRARGYSDLLDALEFHGSISYDASERYADLSLKIVPLNREAQPVTLQIFGTPAALYLVSDLLGDEAVLISSASLLDFAVKTYYRLGLKLHYPALLFPYVYEFAAAKIINRWNKIYTASADRETLITPGQISSLAKSISTQLNRSSDLNTLITALGLVGGKEDTVAAIFESIPEYLTQTLTDGEAVVIHRDAQKETWSARKQVFYTHGILADRERIRLRLPAFPNGYVPSFSWTRIREDQREKLTISASLAHPSEEALFAFSFSADGLPASWPSAAHADGSLSLTGALVPQGSFLFTLDTDPSGAFTAEIRKPSGPEAEGRWWIQAEGTLLPREIHESAAREPADLHATDILRVNDTTLSEFVNRVRFPAAVGLIRFIVGLPVSACQTILDDLTDTGVLGILLPME